MLSSVQFYYVYVLSLFHSVTNYNMQKWTEYEKCFGEIIWPGEEQFDTRRKTDSPVDRPRREANKSE